MPACANARRKPTLRASLTSFMDRVPGAAHGLDQLRLARPVDLGTQTADVGVDDAALGVEMKVPDLLQEHRAGDDAPGMPHQVLEQHELTRLELHRPPGARDPTTRRIELELGDL